MNPFNLCNLFVLFSACGAAISIGLCSYFGVVLCLLIAFGAVVWSNRLVGASNYLLTFAGGLLPWGLAPFNLIVLLCVVAVVLVGIIRMREEVSQLVKEENNALS